MPNYIGEGAAHVPLTEDEAVELLHRQIPIFVTEHELKPGQDIYRYALVISFHAFNQTYPHMTPQAQKLSMYCNFIVYRPEDEEIIGVFQRPDNALDAAYFWLHSEKREEVVPRSSLDEKTFAFVTARVTKDWQKRSMMGLIIKAVSEWVKTTANGESEWDSTNHDFNVGDLSTWTEDEELIIILRKHGIRDLQIETYVDIESGTTWTYDTVLVDEDFEDEEEE